MLLKFLDRVYPPVISLIFVYLGFTLGFDYKVKNFDKILDSSIVFGSIVIGFLAALLGILVTIRDTDIVREIVKRNQMNTLRYYYNETLLIGFTIVFTASTLHVLRETENLITLIVFYIWNLAVFWFVPSTYRIVSILMSVFFNANNSLERPKSNKIDSKEREEIRKNLTKK